MTDETPPPSRREARRLREASLQNPPDTEPGSSEPHSDVGASASEVPSQDDDNSEVQSAKKKGRARGIFSVIVTGILILVLSVTAVIATAAIIVPAATGSTTLTVLTSSMEPSLPPGTMIVIRPVDPGDIEAGDVVTYQLKSGENTVVTHRVVGSYLLTNGDPVFVTKGDNNPSPDIDPIRAEQIRGELWYSIPYVGWLTNVITGDMRGTIITIAVVVLFGYAAWMIFSGLRDKRKERTKGRDQADDTAA